MILPPVLEPVLQPPLEAISRLRAGGGGVSPIYPLDDVGGDAPEFAYGVVKLASAYDGPALQVVRASDSETLDVGFVGATLDTAALDDFLGSETGHVSVWYDQSGNGNDATQSTDASRPRIDGGSVSGGPITIGGHRAVIQNGYVMALPTEVSVQRRAGHVFQVAENLVSAGSQSALFQLGSSTSQVSFFATSNSGARGYQINPGGSLSWLAQHRTIIYEASLGATSKGAQGAESGTVTSGADLTMTGGYIGNTALAGGYEAKFYSGVHVCYGRVLSSDERTALRDGLNTIFAITENPGGRVVYVGDSITAASTNAASPNQYGYTKMADRALPAHHAYNVAGGGQRVQAQLSAYSTQVGNILTGYSDSRVVLLAYGINDLNNARTDAEVYADIQSYCALIQADGGKVIVATVLPATDLDATEEGYRVALNTSIRTNWASFADGLADFASDPVMGASGAASDTTLYQDGKHPTRVGHSHLATIAAAAIAELL